MEVLLQLELEAGEKQAFQDLILLCNREDGTNYDSGLDYDFFYSIRNEEKKESGIKEEYLAILMGYRVFLPCAWNVFMMIFAVRRFA